MASMMKDEWQPAGPRSLAACKAGYLAWLDTKSGRGWKWALREAFLRAGTRDSLVGEEAFRRATGETLFDDDERHRLFRCWCGADGTVRREVVEADLSGQQESSSAVFANANRGGTLDAYVTPGSKSRGNLESDDSSLAHRAELAQPQAWESASHRPITVASSKRPPQAGAVSAGVAQVTGGTSNNASSVPGGIFSTGFLMASQPPPDPNGGNKSNLPSQAGGIFEDHSNERLPQALNGKPLPPGGTNRSQRSSVPGGIFAAAARPDTVEYGYERFPRQGLEPVGQGSLLDGTAGRR